jgi:hypothetical protein
MDQNNDYINIINKYKKKINYKGLKLNKIIDNINKSKLEDYYKNNRNMMIYRNYEILLNRLLNENNILNKDINGVSSVIQIIKEIIDNIYKNEKIEEYNKEILEIINRINDTIKLYK